MEQNRSQREHPGSLPDFVVILSAVLQSDSVEGEIGSFEAMGSGVRRG